MKITFYTLYQENSCVVLYVGSVFVSHFCYLIKLIALGNYTHRPKLEYTVLLLWWWLGVSLLVSFMLMLLSWQSCGAEGAVCDSLLYTTDGSIRNVFHLGTRRHSLLIMPLISSQFLVSTFWQALRIPCHWLNGPKRRLMRVWCPA